MTSISGLITKFTQINKWLASVSLTLMMLAVVFSAASRGLGYPIIGDIEIVQLTMVALIAGALAYTQHEKAHIAIGIIADHFPKKIQYILDLISAILMTVFSILVAYVFITKMNFDQESLLLEVPFYYFEILLVIGFIGWALESVRFAFNSIMSLLK